MLQYQQDLLLFIFGKRVNINVVFSSSPLPLWFSLLKMTLGKELQLKRVMKEVRSS